MMKSVPDEPHSMTPLAKLEATYIGRDGTYSATASCSTDLPAANLGEVVAEVIHTAWHQGEDPKNAVIVLTLR